MDSKYSNIFWHQGVKVFSDQLLKTETGKVKISHLENDVTKSLLNLFQHCSGKILKTFLKLLDINDNPNTFESIFQVTNQHNFFSKKNRIMLCIISTDTPKKSDPNYNVSKSIPDGCLFNRNTAILIEVKTQSPLIEEQIEAHIKQHLKTATIRIVTWEDISESFISILSKLNPKDKFLVSQFNDFIELLGISEFKGFVESDYRMLGSLGMIPDEDFLDHKRLFHRKMNKFMESLNEKLSPIMSFKNYDWRTAKVLMSSGTWSAFYFHDNKNTGVNDYPNINFNYNEHGMMLAFNSEIKKSVNLILKTIKASPEEFDKSLEQLSNFSFSLYYKLQFSPKNNFVWNFIPGYPKNASSLNSKEVLHSIEQFKQNWADFKKTLIFQMKMGLIKHLSGKLFSQKQLEFAIKKNTNPLFAIALEKRYSIDEIAALKKKTSNFFKIEIEPLLKVAKIVIS